ncbi:nitroreductase family protein [Alicyclobacillus shizuokensis]|uniref:nitroreductase family protein n=1 Tax=Alicyclobacillus shizuokensis TaxID=392014 RepID=UPI0008331DF3|nr:nitroreductase family protein [Alicyclobacillus shizuokensis]MCL6625625.1 nitroreductase family protein [Alicyclobacillus shizuokensis]
MKQVVEGLKEQVAAHRHPNHDAPAVFVNRWSPRAFASRPVDEETLFAVLEAARFAPSANNLQPWRFVLARTDVDRDLFCQFINEGNVTWCQKAPVLLLLASEATMEDGRANRMHAFDAGAAWVSLALAAEMKGLAAHAMGGFDRAKARELLALPDGFEPQVVIALGYQGDAADLPPALQEREQPNGRRPLAETVFEGRFGREVDGLA